MTTYPITRLLTRCLLLFFFIPAAPSLAYQDSIRLFPFAIHADTPKDYIKQGMADLIETQLTAKGFTVVRTEKDADRANALKHAKDGGQNALITGSLTFIGDSVSISIFLIDAETGTNRIAFSKIEPDKNKLFEDINAFTDQISLDPTPAPKPIPMASPQTSITVVPGHVLADGIHRSPHFKTEINAMTVGDVNADGKKDIIYTDLHGVFILTYQNGLFGEPTPLEGETFLDNLFVDVFDGNANGINEIIVTAIHNRNHKTASYAYEWDGTRYTRIAANMDWFFRTGKRPDTGEPVLLGQQQHYANNYFSDTILTMGWDASIRSYVPDQTCKLPDKNMNIFAFDTADIFNKGTMLTISYTPGDYLKILDLTGDESWMSSDRHGGSSKFIEPRKPGDQERYYLPLRIRAGDFNGDGKHEIVTLMNKNSTPRIFSNLRNFVEGHVECLGWNALGFDTLWTTQAISGYIPDFDIDDLNDDGINDLIYCVVPKKASMLSKQTSYIVIQPITAR